MRNGALSDATVHVLVAGTKANVAHGRTDTKQNTNPRMFRVTGGYYDAVVKTVEIAGRPEHRFNNIHVGGCARIEDTHDFTSGTLPVGAVRAGTLVDVTMQVGKADGAVTRGRTYTKANINPETVTLTRRQPC